MAPIETALAGLVVAQERLPNEGILSIYFVRIVDRFSSDKPLYWIIVCSSSDDVILLRQLWACISEY